MPPLSTDPAASYPAPRPALGRQSRSVYRPNIHSFCRDGTWVASKRPLNHAIIDTLIVFGRLICDRQPPLKLNWRVILLTPISAFQPSFMLLEWNETPLLSWRCMDALVLSAERCGAKVLPTGSVSAWPLL